MAFQRPHPGPLLKAEVFKPRNLKAREVAELFHLNEANLSKITNQRTPLNLQMCCRIEIVFGEDAEKWALRQLQYDLDKAAKGRRKFDPNYFVPKNLVRVHPGPVLRKKIITPDYP